MTDIELADAILAQLSIDEKHPVRTETIAKRLGFKNDRIVRELITDDLIILRGLPIIVSGHKPYGVYIATKPEQAQSEREYLRKYVISFCRRMKYLKIAEKNLLHPEQLKLRLDFRRV